MINFDALRASSTRTSPYQYIISENVITKEQAAEVRRDYPNIKQTGYLPLSKLEATGAFKRLIDDLQKPELAEILSEKLGLDLMDKPRMITVRRLSKHDDGRIHNDSKSKICTMLIYLNEDWDNAEAVPSAPLTAKPTWTTTPRKSPPSPATCSPSSVPNPAGTATPPSKANAT